MRYLDKIYKQSDTSWFTPVELFKAIGSLSLSCMLTHICADSCVQSECLLFGCHAREGIIIFFFEGF